MTAKASARTRTRLPVAAVITEWRKNSHADVLLGRLLDPQDWGHSVPFDLELVSVYADQFPAGDLCRPLCAKHGVPIFDTVKGALGAGRKELPVSGVLLIGEHGDYPHNAIGQHLYPRRRLFEECIHALRILKKRLPIFCDKHLSYDWLFARWMWDLARHHEVPFMAGSSLPLTVRLPELDVPIGARLDAPLALGYGDLDAYGFHALETLQCVTERRQGGETGVASVRCLSGPAVWDGPETWPRHLLGSLSGPLSKVNPRAGTLPRNPRDTVFLIQYADGLEAAVAMLQAVGQFAFACECAAGGDVKASVFALHDQHPFPHFGYLLRAIEHMVKTGAPAYPVERTVLTTGVLAALLRSHAEGGARIATPHLTAISYQPSDWPPFKGPLGAPG